MSAALQIKQTKFTGELTPESYGDTSNPKYVTLLRTCLNWIPTPQGALVKRVGTKFIAITKNDGASPSRLREFVFSDQQAFLLEFSDLLARFYSNGKYVGVGGLGVGAYRELVMPYSYAVLQYLKFAQIANTVTITYGSQVGGSAAPQDLVRTAGALWPWSVGPTPLRIPITNVPNAPTVNISGWLATSAYSVGDQVAFSHVLWSSLQDTNVGNSPPTPALNSAGTGLAGTIYWTPSVDPAHPAITVSWVLTAVVQDPNGITYETGPSAPISGTGPLSSDRRVPLVCGGLTTALPAGWTVLLYKLYRANSAGSLVYGWLQDIAPPAFTAIIFDQGAAPDFTKQPPKATDPFLVNGADLFPAVIGYLDQRRLWARSPNMLMFSKNGDLYNYDNLNTPGAETDAFNVALASEVLEEVRSFVPMRRGLLLTGQGEWAISGPSGGPVARGVADPKRQSGWGSSWLSPITVGNGIIFNTAKSNQVRDLFPLYGTYTDIWDGQDLTVISRHLMERHTVKAWAFQTVPYPVIWIVRDDGILLSLTYQHAPPSFGQQLTEGVVAWAQHFTGSGSDLVEDVCVVPEPPEDAVYLIVNRLVGGVRHRFIERMGSQVSPTDERYSRYLDCSITYDGHNDQLGIAGNATLNSVASPGSVLAADYMVGSQVVITVPAGFVAADAQDPYGSGFVFDPENTLGLGNARMHIVGYTSATQATAELDVNLSQAQVNAFTAGVGAWAIAKAQATAAHLSGYALDSNDVVGTRAVFALVDGLVQLPVAWAGGVASFQAPGVVIQLGLAYNADMAMLDVYHPSMEMRNRFKDLKRIGFELAGTRDMWFGQDFGSLKQLLPKFPPSYSILGLISGYFEDFVTGEPNKTGAAVIRHFQPLPAVLSSVLREMNIGDT